MDSVEQALSSERMLELGQRAASQLANQTYAKIKELGAERLHYRLTLFNDNTHLAEESPGVYIIWLKDEFAWINNGLPKFNMIEGLLKGANHKVIPFSNGPGHGAASTPKWQMDLVNTVKAEMKSQKIPWANIEKDDQGRPKLGRLHTLQVKTPDKTHVGPGMGHGEIGAERSGFADKPGGKPFLAGAAVYQNKNDVTGKVDRKVLTFRTVSRKQLGTGMWDHPGFAPSMIFEDAYDWALKELNQNIMPNLVREMSQK